MQFKYIVITNVLYSLDITWHIPDTSILDIYNLLHNWRMTYAIYGMPSWWISYRITYAYNSSTSNNAADAFYKYISTI